MRYFKINYIIVALLLFLAISKVIDWTIPKGPSKEDIIQEMKYKAFERKANQFINNRIQRRLRNEESQKKITKDSLFIWNADREYRDSIRSIINPS